MGFLPRGARRTAEPAAVCLVGPLQGLQETAERLIERVVEPLNADLFVCSERRTPHDEAWLDALEGCRIVDRYVYDAPENGYASLADADARTLRGNRCWRDQLGIGGSWLGGVENRQGSGMRRLVNAERLLERVRTLEGRGRRYARFVITRADIQWLYWHPPLELLDRRYLWLPSGQDYTGYTDRHAVSSRRHLDAYLGPYRALLSGEARRYLRHERELDRQRHLKLHLDYHGVPVGRFARVAYETTFAESGPTWAPLESRAAGEGRSVVRYESERHAAVQNAEALRRGGSWRRMLKRETTTGRWLRWIEARIKLAHRLGWRDRGVAGSPPLGPVRPG